MSRRDERGQVVLPLMLGALAGLIGIALVGRWGVAAVHAARAQSVADATALAVAFDGPSGRSVAAGTDAVVVLWGGRGRAEVVATVGGQVAAAAAVAQSTDLVRRAGLAPSMVAALARAEVLLGSPIQISSGYRDQAAQQLLWDQREQNLYPVAPPGSSLHERGLAADVALSQVAALAAVAARAGLCHPLPEIDPVHFVACPIPD